jgi:hypothetical protein
LWFRGAIVAVATGVLLSACIPFRAYSNGASDSGLSAIKSVPLSDITPYVPDDLRTSGEDVLVLIQMSRYTYSEVGITGSGTQANSVGARFMKGNELSSLSQTVTVGSGSGVMFFIPLMVTGIPLGGVSTFERLEVLCLVAQDGRVVMLYPYASPPQEVLTPAKKEAIVSAIQVSADTQFEDTVGPCGVIGKLDWSEQLRSKVSDFIVRLPARD